MAYAPPWTEKEFKTLLANEKLSNEELSKVIGRSPGAIAAVRAGINYWRKGEDTHNMLSQMMLQLLSNTRNRNSI